MPNCYECKYRGNVPGDTHSSCHYPGVESDDFLGFFNPNNRQIMLELNIEADPHGIRNGWFLWPANFDPVWLINCDGFKQKTADAATSTV